MTPYSIGRLSGRLTLIFGLAFAVASCAEAGIIASAQKQFSTSDTLMLSKPAQNFIPVATEVGAALGYDLTRVDNEHNSLSFADNTSLGVGVLIGKYGFNQIVLTLAPDGRAIKLEISLTGNFDTATPAAASDRLTKFKAALASRFQ